MKCTVNILYNYVQYDFWSKMKKFTEPKNVMQGKLIAVAYTLRTYWNQFSWAEFLNKNRCISVRLVSEEVKSIKFW